MSIAWFWLTWLASAANASGSGFGVVGDALVGRRRRGGRSGGGGRRRRRGGGRRLLGVSGGRRGEEHGDQRTRDERACQGHGPVSAPRGRLLSPQLRARVRPEGSRRREARSEAVPQRSPRDELRASIPHLARGFPPKIRSSPPRLVDNVARACPTRSRPGSSAPSPNAATTWRCGRRSARTYGTLTFGDYADRATRLAAGLRTLGVGPGDRVVMLIGNRPEFHVADMAVLLLGATPISIYNSSSPDQIRYLAGHAQATVAIVEHGDFLERVLEVRADLPALRHVVVIEPVDATGRRVVGRAALAPRRSISRPRPRSRSRTISPRSSTRRARPGRRRA